MNYSLLVISLSVGTYLGASVGRYFACCGRIKVRPYIQCDMMVHGKMPCLLPQSAPIHIVIST